MIFTEPAVKVRQNLGELINKVQFRHDAILITKADKPVAAIIDIDLFDKVRRMKAEFERLSAKFAEAYQNVDNSVAEKEINKAVISVRRYHQEKPE